MTIPPDCPYCGKPSKLVTGEAIYSHRPDLYHKKFYQCADCDAYVGCHPKTKEPLGRLADATLRRGKIAAHQAFDLIWKDGHMKRSQAYAWLAAALGIPGEECHIGMFSLDLCQQVVEVCREELSPPTASQGPVRHR